MKWEEKNNSLYKKYEFKNFVSVMSFKVECSFHIERLNHHPTWCNTYNVLEIYLSTHDAGNIVTDKDVTLSKVLDECYEKYQ